MAGFNWLDQQQTLGEPMPGSGLPERVGQPVVIAATDEWAVLGWLSATKGLCIDVAFRGQSATGCGFPVSGAAAEPVAPTEQKMAAGVGVVRGRGPQVVVAGLAAPSVANVDLLLVDGRTIPATMHEAPAELATTLRFFVSRFDYTGPLPPLAGGGLVTQYLAYDQSGQRLGGSPN